MYLILSDLYLLVYHIILNVLKQLVTNLPWLQLNETRKTIKKNKAFVSTAETEKFQNKMQVVKEINLVVTICIYPDIQLRQRITNQLFYYKIASSLLFSLEKLILCQQEVN